MKIINGILILEKEHDYDKNDVIWEDNKSVRLYSLGVIHHNNNHTFPQFYKYSEAFDLHFCGEYYPIAPSEAIAEIKGHRDQLYAKVKALDDFISKL